MANCKLVMSIYVVVCCMLICQQTQAKPVEYGMSNGKVSLNSKLLQALSKQHSNSQSAAKLDQMPLSLQDLLNSQKAYYPNSEIRQMPADSGSVQYSPLEQMLMMQKMMTDYENNNNQQDYFQPDQINNDNGFYYADGQDGWFDGPVEPQVNPLLDDLTEDQLNDLISKFFLMKQYEQLMEEKSGDEEEDSNVEKRRQKIVIKDDFAEQSTPSTPVASTASSQRKAKLVHKPAKNFHRGQKEVPLLRPAEIKPKEWPSELEESNLSQVCTFNC